MLKTSALMTLGLLLLVIPYSFGTTVTLTGSCPLAVVNSTNNHIMFNLSNTGDGVAGGVTVFPIIKGALTYNSSAYISELLPDQSNTVLIWVSNLTAPGEYVDYFVTRYSQGEQSFITVFPCVTAMQQRSQSMVQVANLNVTKGKVLATLYNAADYPVNASASLEVPPSFNVDRPVSNITISPQSTLEVSFNITAPQATNATFPISFAASYLHNETHYAVLSVTDFSTAPPQSTSSVRLSPPEIIFLVLIVGVICLITISISKKRRRHMKAPASKTSEI
ncbi:MAG: hypothetical protein KGH66_01735 [Candidatus Micrarchaeota archaeon]|nr:hypothetical protein [Candidatus Micrarchaeota archaeon]